MKHLRAVLTFAFTLLLAACAPAFSAGDRTASSDLQIFPQTPSKVAFSVIKPAKFPDPSITYRLLLDCANPNGVRQAIGESGARLQGFKAFAATNPEVDVRPKRIRVRTVTLYCEDNRIVYKAASLNELFVYINDSGPKTSFGAAGNSIEFEVKSGYLYPNLRLDYYSFSTTVFFEEGSVYASNEPGGVVPVVLVQNNVPKPVVFEGKRSRASFDPSQQATLVVKRGLWDVLDFNYSDGTLTWNQVKRRPY